jgi:hypothetical protein
LYAVIDLLSEGAEVYQVSNFLGLELIIRNILVGFDILVALFAVQMNTHSLKISPNPS